MREIKRRNVRELLLSIICIRPVLPWAVVLLTVVEFARGTLDGDDNGGHGLCCRERVVDVLRYLYEGLCHGTW
jgi:hypothetical protein